MSLRREFSLNIGRFLFSQVSDFPRDFTIIHDETSFHFNSSLLSAVSRVVWRLLRQDPLCTVFVVSAPVISLEFLASSTGQITAANYAALFDLSIELQIPSLFNMLCSSELYSTLSLSDRLNLGSRALASDLSIPKILADLALYYKNREAEIADLPDIILKTLAAIYPPFYKHRTRGIDLRRSVNVMKTIDIDRSNADYIRYRSGCPMDGILGMEEHCRLKFKGDSTLEVFLIGQQVFMEKYVLKSCGTGGLPSWSVWAELTPGQWAQIDFREDENEMRHPAAVQVFDVAPSTFARHFQFRNARWVAEFQIFGWVRPFAGQGAPEAAQYDEEDSYSDVLQVAIDDPF
jgi:hypothetical protein